MMVPAVIAIVALGYNLSASDSGTLHNNKPSSEVTEGTVNSKFGKQVPTPKIKVIKF